VQSIHSDATKIPATADLLPPEEVCVFPSKHDWLIICDISNSFTVFLSATLNVIDPVHQFFVILFSIVATLNHMLPLQYRNNIIVKPFLTPVILMNVLPSWLVVAIVVLDTFPILFPSNMKSAELIGSSLRQGYIFYNAATTLPLNILVLFGICNAVYAYERKQRISDISKTREEFGWLHNAEHIAVYLYLYYTTQHQSPVSHRRAVHLILFVTIVVLFVLLFSAQSNLKYSRALRTTSVRYVLLLTKIMLSISSVALMLFTLGHTFVLTQNILLGILFSTICIFAFLIQFTLLKLENARICTEVLGRLPAWFDKALIPTIVKKASKNRDAMMVGNIVVKSWLGERNMCWEGRKTWSVMETDLDKLCSIIRDRDDWRPDICVGVASGGAFLVPYISKNLGCPHSFYLTCSSWSGRGNVWNLIDSLMLVCRVHRSRAKPEVSVLLTSEDELISKQTDLRGKRPLRVLLFDDTLCSGKTMVDCKTFLDSLYTHTADIRTATLLRSTDGVMVTDYEMAVCTKYSGTRIPLVWEWGIELD
jgi:hypoxanthine phosphoribosyltransferase